MITQVESTNAGRFQTFERAFRSGLTIITGNNGVGKSTIIDMLEFAMDGKCSKSKKLSYFKKRGAKGPLTVKMAFDYKGDSWEIMRSLVGKTSTATVTINGDTKATGVDPADKYIAENFFSIDLLRNSNLAAQRGDFNFLAAKPAERFKIAKAIFDVDRYSRIALDVKKGLQDLQAARQQATGKVATLEAGITRVEAFLAQVDEVALQASVKDVDAQIVDVKSKIQSFRETLANLDAQIKDVDAKNVVVRQANAMLESRKRELPDVQAQIVAATKKVEAAREGVAMYECNAQTARDRLAKLNEQVITVPPMPVFDDKAVDTLTSQVATLTVALAEATRKVKIFDAGVCPTCNQPWHPEGDTRESLVDAVGATEAALAEAKTGLAALLTERDAVQDARNAAVAAQDDANALERRKSEEAFNVRSAGVNIKAEEAKIVEASEQISALMARKADVEADLAKMVPLEEVSAVTLVAQKKRWEPALATASTTLATLEQTKTGLIQQAAQISASKSDLIMRKEELTAVMAAITTTDKEIEAETAVFAVFDKQLPSFVIHHRLQAIESVINDFLGKLRSPFIVKHEISEKDTLDVTIFDSRDKEFSDFSNLSGFESSIVSIAHRVGVAYYNKFFNKNPIDWIILDEPDKSATEDNAVMLFEAIRELTNQFNQIIIISHRPSVFSTFRDADVIHVVSDGKDSHLE